MSFATMFLLLTCCIALTGASFYEDHFDDIRQVLDKENQQKNSRVSWKAGLNKNFAGKSLWDIKMLMGMYEEEKSNSIPEPSTEELELNKMNINLPEEFDARKNWPECSELISFIKDQSTCGSCWAVSAASAMSDRTCIASKGKRQIFLSDEELVSCCKSCGYGCNGGYPVKAFKYWVEKGLPTGGPYGDKTCCKPYSIAPCTGRDCHEARTPKCTDSCISEYNGTLTDRYYGSTWFQFWLGEYSIMKDIYLHGPVVAGFTVYSDFLYYKSGVYEHKAGTMLGGHAVRIIGWGKDEDHTKYWLVANSWNTTFGEDGLFKIRRGVYECGIERWASAGYAKSN